MRVTGLEKEIGIEVYASQGAGISGVIKQFPEDFVVEEILMNGSKAEASTQQPSPFFASKGRYLVCVLVKRDWDTLLVVRRIAQKLGISVELVDFAGLKDTRALTAQHLSFAMTRPEQIEQIEVKDVKLQPIGYSSNKIVPAMLYGNHFTITIRAVAFSRSPTIEKHVLNVKRELENIGGLPNFFGHQRFGTARAITHLVGKALVQGDVEKAVLTYLAEPSRYEHPEAQEARLQLRKTHDFKAARNEFPSSLKYEHTMLHHLSRNPNDFYGAFRAMPLRLRRLFIQAYQSYLFNRFLSQRLKNGLPLNRLTVGDYVVMLNDRGLPVGKHEIVTPESVDALKKLVDWRKAGLALPLVGFNQMLSSGWQGELEQAIIKEENVRHEDFMVKHLPELKNAGGLRVACVPLLDFSLKEITADLANPSKHAVRLSFTLYRGCYATVVLRELMKPRDMVKAGF